MSQISHGSGQMKAQSISIQLSTRERCNASCRFCISRTTPGCEVGSEEVTLCSMDGWRKGLNYAEHVGATHAILTGRADPTQEDINYLTNVIDTASEYLPLVDMHTNGFLLQAGKPQEGMLQDLVDAGLTMITFSIASFNVDINQDLMGLKVDARKLIKKAVDLGLLVRCSLVVNKSGEGNFHQVMSYIREAGEAGAHMVVLRGVWVPDVVGDNFNKEVLEWNKKNVVDIKSIQDQFIIQAIPDNEYGIRQFDPLPWGTPVFGVGGVFTEPNHGVNVTFAICDENVKGSVMKSIVHKPNGHGYRNWDHNGNIIY